MNVSITDRAKHRFTSMKATSRGRFLFTAVQEVSVDLRLGYRFWLPPGTKFEEQRSTFVRTDAGQAITIAPL